MVCNPAVLPASSRRRLKAALVRAKADLLREAEHLELEHLERVLVHPLLQAVLEVRVQVKVALADLVEPLEQDRADHPAAAAPTRSPILRMARFPTP